MVTLTAWPTRIITFGRTFLMTGSLKYRRVQIQRKTRPRANHHTQQPPPERTPETLNRRLGEAVKEAPHSIGSRPSFQSQQGVQCPVRSGHFCMGKALGPDHHSNTERR